jgi:hypothetical protein
LSSQDETNGLLETDTALCVGASERWERFCKNLASTGVLVTTKATNVQHEMDRTPTSRKIVDGPTVVAVYLCGHRPTIGAGSGWRRYLDSKSSLIGTCDLRNLQVWLKKV